MTRLTPSLVLGDRYRLDRRIAGGGMGEVWAARDIILERSVAVKVLRSEYAEDPSFRQRFLAEARHAALLSHPGIAGVFDFGDADGTSYIVMELVEGETLAAILAREGKLTPGRTMDIIGQAAMALQAAHDAGVVHRDVKPANFIVRPDGVVKVTDFGIARALAGASMTMTGNVLGTVHYIAPEQARGERVTPASDTYALGVVAWECLQGARPFAYDSPVAVATAHASEPLPPLDAAVPPAVRELVEQATQKDPSLRQTSVGVLGRNALALAAGLDPTPYAAPTRVDADATVVLPAVAAPASDATSVLRRLDTSPGAVPLPAPARPRRNRNGLWRILAALAVVAAIVTVALLARGDEPRDRTPTPTKSMTTSKPAATPTSTPASITLDPAAYVGRPYLEVEAALQGLGLKPAPVQSPSATVPVNSVIGVQAGPYRRGQDVQVVVSSGPPVAPVPSAPSPTDNQEPGGDDSGNDDGTNDDGTDDGTNDNGGDDPVDEPAGETGRANVKAGKADKGNEKGRN